MAETLGENLHSDPDQHPGRDPEILIITGIIVEEERRKIDQKEDLDESEEMEDIIGVKGRVK